ncbi:D-alanine aminotransferase [hydrothermal vent metagenome]|uniref:D-alanine aminotransferase n=1 Tax=hydrothermal vent metagenome TaxID=652676 RepID=A0A3B0X9E3_9ZZZZ
MSKVYLNGEYMALDQAKVSVLDRGFLFADGVYEVIPAYGGHLLRMEEHLQRLQNSLDAIRLQNPLKNQQWRDIIQSLLSDVENEVTGSDKSVYLQVTRGAAPIRNHGFPQQIKQTVFIMVNELGVVNKEDLRSGVSAITLDDIRWKACNIKSISLLGNILLRQQAHDNNAAEAILINQGMVTEGAASNVFAVINNVLVTAPIGPQLLPGITRDLIVELGAKNNIAVEEREYTEEELLSASEIWFSSSTKEILPVVELNGKPVANGRPGPMWEKMIDLYQANKENLRNGSAK